MLHLERLTSQSFVSTTAYTTSSDRKADHRVTHSPYSSPGYSITKSVGYAYLASCSHFFHVDPFCVVSPS
ncbi:unnamed protein product [Lupinus luteus]|uniref:Uncharacterized protein n=1 Tax=Lupinus luteus TaxID=3873 RepID=A0AAV1VXB0_LUPLU